MIEVAAVVFRNSFGHVLTVRKDSSTKFQLPGGKLEAGETPAQAAAREVAEEIGVEVRLPELSPLGTFDAPAADAVITDASPTGPTPTTATTSPSATAP